MEVGGLGNPMRSGDEWNFNVDGKTLTWRLGRELDLVVNLGGITSTRDARGCLDRLPER